MGGEIVCMKLWALTWHDRIWLQTFNLQTCMQQKWCKEKDWQWNWIVKPLETVKVMCLWSKVNGHKLVMRSHQSMCTAMLCHPCTSRVRMPSKGVCTIFDGLLNLSVAENSLSVADCDSLSVAEHDSLSVADCDSCLADCDSLCGWLCQLPCIACTPWSTCNMD